MNAQKSVRKINFVSNPSIQTVKVGEEHERTFTVEEKHCVEFTEKGIDPILSTPWLIWSLEHTAHDLLDKYLTQEEVSLGTHVDIEHLGLTTEGRIVKCIAKVIHIDKQVINLQVEAYDGPDLICKGVHKRQIVSSQRFQKAVLKKNNS